MPVPTYATIEVRGNDAEDFLQGQLTIDVRELDASRSFLGAWCNPKGRVICLFDVRRAANGYDLTLPAELSDDVVKRLTMFRFRAQVLFDIRKSGPVESAIDRLRAGVPQVFAAQSEEFTPHMLNLDLLGAVSLDKGCYTGQEIVARTHYRGASKRRLQRFGTDGTAAPGDKVVANGRNVGTVVNVEGAELLAVVPIDKAGDEQAVNGAALTRLPLPYL